MAALVSIIVTVYRGEQWIGDTLRSVLTQDYPRLEVVVVDDASPDGSQEIVREMIANDQRIRLFVNATNRGIPAARNRGLDEARGKFLCILDQDDHWLPGKASQQAAWLEQNAHTGLVYCRVERIDGRGESLGIRSLTPPTSGLLFRKFMQQGTAVPLLSCMFNRQLLDQIGPFEETLKGQDDYEFLLRAARCTPFGLVDRVLVQQRFRPGTFGQSEEMAEDQLQLARLVERRWPQEGALVRNFTARAHYNRALFAAGQGEFKEARRHFYRCCRLRPFHLKAWLRWLTTFLPPRLRSRLPARLRP